MTSPANDPSTRAPTTSESIGLIGLGLMGSAIAERLVAGGFQVLGFDTNPTQCAALQSMGASCAADSTAIVTACNRIILSLPDLTFTQSVIETIATQLRPGQIIIDTSTGDPAQAAAIGDRLAKSAVAYLDATISGSSAQLQSAAVTVMAGGSREAFDRCRDLFDSFAQTAIYLGVSGNGSKMKLVSNLVLGLNRAALAEALSFAKALGLDLELVLKVLIQSPAYSRIMESKGPKMISGDFNPQARLSQHLKDVRLILAAARQSNARVPLTHVHELLLRSAEAAGFGFADNSAIIRAFDRPGDREK